MNAKNLAGLSNMFDKYSQDIELYSQSFHDNLLSYWKNHDALHHFFTVSQDENGNIAGTISKLNFSFITHNRFVISPDELLSEVNFITNTDNKEISLLKCYIHYTKEFTFETASSEELFDIEYDDVIERRIFNEVIKSAYDKELISAD